MGDLSTRAALLHEVMSAHVAAGRPPGLVMALAQDDELYVDTIGTMEIGGRVPMGRDTIFRVASLTKPVLAAATMLLVEDGELALDEPVERLLPELADRRVLRDPEGPLDDVEPAHRSFTIEDLLTFRWGYGYREGLPESAPISVAARELGLATRPNAGAFPPDEWLGRLASLPLMAQPGEQWLYDTGADVLGVLLARGTGSPLGALLTERVFDPLGMVDSGFFVAADQLHRLPPCYGVDESTGEPVVYDPVDGAWSREPVFPSAGGGMVATLDDYLAFARALLGRTPLLSAATVELMATDHLRPDQHTAPLLGDRGWGLGLSTGGGGRPRRYGWDGGSGTVWFSDPDQRSIAILLTQQAFGASTMAIFEDFRATASDVLAGGPG